MFKLILLGSLLTLFASTSLAQEHSVDLGCGIRVLEPYIEDSDAFLAYRDRVAERRDSALQLRAEINAGKPPARGWLAIRVPFPLPPNPYPIRQGEVIIVPTPLERMIYSLYRERAPVIRVPATAPGSSL